MPIDSHSAIWPGNDGLVHRQRIETHFGVRLTAADSSYYSTLWRWRPPPKRRWWQRRHPPAPDGLLEIRFYDNVDPIDSTPFYDGFPLDAWVVTISTSQPDMAQHAAAWLYAIGRRVE